VDGEEKMLLEEEIEDGSLADELEKYLMENTSTTYK
jgi:hypothetical protein